MPPLARRVGHGKRLISLPSQKLSSRLWERGASSPNTPEHKTKLQIRATKTQETLRRPHCGGCRIGAFVWYFSGGGPWGGSDRIFWRAPCEAKQHVGLVAVHGATLLPGPGSCGGGKRECPPPLAPSMGMAPISYHSGPLHHRPPWLRLGREGGAMGCAIFLSAWHSILNAKMTVGHTEIWSPFPASFPPACT